MNRGRGHWTSPATGRRWAIGIESDWRCRKICLNAAQCSARDNPQLLTQVLRIVYQTISGDLLRAAHAVSRWRLRSSSGGRGRGGEAGVSADGSAEQRSAAGAGAARRRAHRARARAARATGTRLRMSPATRRAICFCDRQRARGKIPDRRSRIESARQTPIVEVPILALADRRAITGLERQRRDIRGQ